VRLVGVWNNGKPGRMARRDIFLRIDDDAGTWQVEAREGGPEGTSRYWDDRRTKDEVLALLVDLQDDPDEVWTDITDAYDLGASPPRR
jgi:hypothetical protein